MRLLLTGGAGFIGAHFARRLARGHPRWSITIIGDDCRIERTSVQHAVILNGGCTEEVERLEDSLVGRNTVVVAGGQAPRALRLLVGDDAEVRL